MSGTDWKIVDESVGRLGTEWKIVDESAGRRGTAQEPELARDAHDCAEGRGCREPEAPAALSGRGAAPRRRARGIAISGEESDV